MFVKYLTPFLSFTIIVLCPLMCLCTMIAYIANNNMDLDQTASLGDYMTLIFYSKVIALSLIWTFHCNLHTIGKAIIVS